MEDNGMIHQLNLYGKDRVEVAIDRLQTFEPRGGYYLCFSGGKDSCVIKALADMANVKYDAHYNATGIDPPELIYFMREYHKDVEWDIPRDKDGNRITMWSLIPKKRMPPTRLVRYCCEELKEGGGEGRMVVTGVRWAESTKRKNNRHLIEEQGKRGKKIMQFDNIDDAQQFKFCPIKHKQILNPIIDWTESDVWEFIHEYKIPYCCLYDQGYKRLGCIGCPMSGGKKQIEEFNKYPKFKSLYLKAFEAMLRKRESDGLKTVWETPEEVMDWWTGGK